MSEQTVSLSVDVVEKETEKAYLFVVGGEKIWMPKGQIRNGEVSEGDKELVVEITKWIAEQKGLSGEKDSELEDDPNVPRTPQVTKEIDFEDIPF